MDSLTHALIIAIPLTLIGRSDLAVYGIMGAVLIDVDVLFGLFSGRDARLYIFTHGGITHSFFGAFIIAMLASVPAYVLWETGLLGSMLAPFGLLAMAAILAGALSHLTVDYLAYPGIPLFYPLSDKKYTLGIMGGPSGFIMLASVAFIAAMVAGLARIDRPWIYVGFSALVVAMSLGTKAYAALKTKARTIATMSPFRWMVIEETPDAYHFYIYDLFKPVAASESYEKFKGTTPDDAGKNDAMPEVKRLRYHSYIVTVENDGRSITYRDPIRENGHIWYPPYYKSYSIAVQSGSAINSLQH